MKRRKHISSTSSALGLAALLTFGWSSAVGAFLITDTGADSEGNPGGQDIYEVSGLIEGDAFNLTWGGVAGLSATAMVFIDALDDDDAVIRVMIDNTSDPISGDDPRITSFGISIDILDFNSGTGGTFLTVADFSTFPGFGDLLCATSGSNCAGGGPGGIPAGQNDEFTFAVGGIFGSVLTLDAFALKIQGGPQGDSFELAGVPSEKTTPPEEVPEPTTLLLLGVGLAGLGFTRRRLH